MKFYLGDRVRISTKYHWAQNALGTVALPPEFPQQQVQDQAPWEGCHRFVQGVNRKIEFYWVNFDEPQEDADGDGPYMGGEIDAEMMELIAR